MQPIECAGGREQAGSLVLVWAVRQADGLLFHLPPSIQRQQGMGTDVHTSTMQCNVMLCHTTRFSDAVLRGTPLSRPFTDETHTYMPGCQAHSPTAWPCFFGRICTDRDATHCLAFSSTPSYSSCINSDRSACMHERNPQDMLHWHPSLRLPGWFRRLVLAALALCVCTTCFVRLCLLAGPGAGALQSLQARNIRQPRWNLAGLPLWTRKTRVAVLQHGDASSDGVPRFHPALSPPALASL